MDGGQSPALASLSKLAHKARTSRLGGTSERIDYAAFAYSVLLAGSDHTPKFRPQRLQACDLALDFVEMASGQSVDARAGPVDIIGKIEQLPDPCHREAEITRAPYEIEARFLCWSIVAIIGLRARRGRKNTLALVVADCFRFDACYPGDLTNSHIVSSSRLTL
jgi:hypothetical protein